MGTYQIFVVTNAIHLPAEQHEKWRVPENRWRGPLQRVQPGLTTRLCDCTHQPQITVIPDVLQQMEQTPQGREGKQTAARRRTAAEEGMLR